MPFRRLLPLVLALMLLPAFPALAAVQVDVTEMDGGFHYAFALPGEEFALLDYSAPQEKGSMVLWSENGAFEGDVALRCSQAGGALKVTVKNLDERTQGEAKLTLAKDPAYAAPTGKSTVKVTNFVLKETGEGIAYSFLAPGSDFMMLCVHSKQETYTFPVYPQDETGLYQGEIVTPLTYPRSQITVQVQTAKGLVQEEEKARKGYQAPDPAEQREGRLSGVTVCIDPGHAENGQRVLEPIGPGLTGKTSGTSGMAQGISTKRMESIVVLEISMLLRDELLRQGANVVLTRTAQDGWLSNLDRCQVAEDAGAQIMLRLHGDTRESHTKLGFSVYGPLNSTYARAEAEPKVYRAMGEMLIDDMKRAVGYALEDKYGIVHLNDQFVGNNWAKMTCFLVEMGYMSTPREDYLLSHPVWQSRIAQGMAQGVYDIAVYRGWIAE